MGEFYRIPGDFDDFDVRKKHNFMVIQVALSITHGDPTNKNGSTMLQTVHVDGNMSYLRRVTSPG
jgi:hypothetical protein